MKTIVITGIGRGIGKALAQKFLAEGWRVVGTTMTGEASSSHEHLSVVKLDVRDSASIASAVNAIVALGSPIDMHINNAGVLLDEDDTRVVPEKLRATLEVNLIGAIEFTERLIPHMNDGAHIINISSTAGSISLSRDGASHFPYHYPAYKISKAALNMYTRTLANVLGSRICVSSVHPGWVKTDMGGEEADITPEEAAERIHQFTLQRVESGNFWFNGKPLPW